MTTEYHAEKIRVLLKSVSSIRQIKGNKNWNTLCTYIYSNKIEEREKKRMMMIIMIMIIMITIKKTRCQKNRKHKMYDVLLMRAMIRISVVDSWERKNEKKNILEAEMVAKKILGGDPHTTWRMCTIITYTSGGS